LRVHHVGRAAARRGSLFRARRASHFTRRARLERGVRIVRGALRAAPHREKTMTKTTVAVLAAFALAACNLDVGGKQDPYAQSKMDLKPAPAKVGGERHKGAFAEGAALSTGPELKPLDPSPVKTVRLD